MSRGIYVGSNEVARKVKKIYVGVNGSARKVVKGYVGVNGVARQFYPSGGGADTNYVYIEPREDYAVNTEYSVSYADTLATLVYSLEIIRKVCKCVLYSLGVYDSYASHIGDVVAITRNLLSGNTIKVSGVPGHVSGYNYNYNYLSLNITWGNTSVQSFKTSNKYDDRLFGYVYWDGATDSDGNVFYLYGNYIRFNFHEDGTFTYTTGSGAGTDESRIRYIGTRCEPSNGYDTVRVCNIGMVNSTRTKASNIDWHWRSDSLYDTIDNISIVDTANTYPTIDSNDKILTIPYSFGRGRTVTIDFSMFERKYTTYDEGEPDEYRAYSSGSFFGVFLTNAGQYSAQAYCITFPSWSSTSEDLPKVWLTGLGGLRDIVDEVEFSSEEEMRTCLNGGTLTMTWASDGSGVTFDINGIVTLTANWSFVRNTNGYYGRIGKLGTWNGLYKYTISEITIK